MEEPTEQEIAEISTAPRITPSDIEANIVSEHYFTAADGLLGSLLPNTDEDDVPFDSEDGRNVWDIIDEDHPQLRLLTFCVLILRNGFTVTGESACVDPANFEAFMGRQIARANAIKKMWPLMGYELRSKLSGL